MITDIFNSNSENEASLIAEPEAFDIMNNDVVTLKPSHDLLKQPNNNAKTSNISSLQRSIPVMSTLDSEIPIDHENDILMGYIDFKFDELVIVWVRFV